MVLSIAYWTFTKKVQIKSEGLRWPCAMGFAFQTTEIHNIFKNRLLQNNLAGSDACNLLCGIV